MVFPVPAGHKSFNLKVGDIVQLEGGVITMITAYWPTGNRFGAPSEVGWLTWTPEGKGQFDRNSTNRSLRGLKTCDIAFILGRTWQ